MALKPITRQEKIIAGENLTPITRMEKFLKEYGGSGGGNSSPSDWNAAEGEPGHILNKPCTVVITCSYDDELGEYVLTADKTFEECCNAFENNNLFVVCRSSRKGNYNVLIEEMASPATIEVFKEKLEDETYAVIGMVFCFVMPLSIGSQEFDQINWSVETGIVPNA